MYASIGAGQVRRRSAAARTARRRQRGSPARVRAEEGAGADPEHQPVIRADRCGASPRVRCATPTRAPWSNMPSRTPRAVQAVRRCVAVSMRMRRCGRSFANVRLGVTAQSSAGWCSTEIGCGGSATRRSSRGSTRTAAAALTSNATATHVRGSSGLAGWLVGSVCLRSFPPLCCAIKTPLCIEVNE